MKDAILATRVRGCLLGGAVGDALGAPVEFMKRSQIIEQFGSAGVTGLVPAYGALGAITDDTQLTLFTAEGLLRAKVRGDLRGICNPASVMRKAYRRWLKTQGEDDTEDSIAMNGWLVTDRRLFARRAPGLTCLAALRGNGHTDTATNDSKGAGGVMRIAPVGIMAAVNAPDSVPWAASEAFTMGCEVAGITHGHPTGQLAAGVMASVVAQVLLDIDIRTATRHALSLAAKVPGHLETIHACEAALDASADAGSCATFNFSALGQGWVAEEALAIALYCALVAPDFRSATLMAVNHDGDSDTTGSLVGQLLGAQQGTSVLPTEWLEHLELRDVIEAIADDLVASSSWDLDDAVQVKAIWHRYPGG